MAASTASRMTIKGQLIKITPETVEIPAPRKGKPAQLSEREARELTQTIRHTGIRLWLLVAEAHDRGAWSALGYETWKDYVTQELQISESRSYQILDQAKVMREIALAGADVNDVDPVPARLVLTLKDRLPAVRRAVKSALRNDEPVEDALRDLAKRVKATETNGDATVHDITSLPRQRTTSATTTARTSTTSATLDMPKSHVECPACSGKGHVTKRIAKVLAGLSELRKT